MAIVIAKNVDVSDVTIEDLGTVIPLGDQETLTDNYSFVEVCDSKDLKTLVQNGNIVINDGTEDLGMADGLKHIGLKSEYEDEQQDDSIAGDKNVDGGRSDSVYLAVQNIDGGGAT